MVTRPEGLITPHIYPLLNTAQPLLKQVTMAKEGYQLAIIENTQVGSTNYKQKRSNLIATQHKQLMTSGYSLGLGPSPTGV
jgi:hypothetical protein